MEKRTIRYIDIGEEKTPDLEKKYEPSLFKSKLTGRGLLVNEWLNIAEKPIMCCYKLVKVKMSVFAFQGKLESWILNTQLDYFVKFYKKVFCLLDEWYPLNIQQIRTFEEQTKQELAKVNY